MRIDLLKTEPDRAGRYWISLDNGKKMALYRQTVEDFGLYSGKELSDVEFERLEAASGAMSAKMRAVRIVAASAVSKKDLQQRLVQKGEDSSQAAEAVAWMEEMHLVDDEETARQIVSRCAAKGYGLSRAKQALYEKKIPKKYWDAALAEYPDQTEHMLRFLRSRLEDTADQKEVKRAIDALLRRGHTYSEIRNALQQMMLDPDEFPEE
jgi:SOS response regulatory protein OraA/RecX